MPNPETESATIKALREEIAAQRIEVSELKAELQQQKDIVSELLKRLYGPSSEKLDPNQLLLKILQGNDVKKNEAAEEEDPEPAADKQREKKRKKGKPRVQRLKESMASLPTIEVEIIPDEVKANPDAYRRIDQEVSERLEVSPATFTRRVIIRPIYVEKFQIADEPAAAPITAPLPPTLLEGSVLSPSLGAYLLTEKFCYHQPFYRQEWRLGAAHGIDLTRNLMCHWHNHLADLLLPIYNLIAAQMRGADYIRVDETPIKYLIPGTKKTAIGQFWVYSHDDYGVLFDWHTSRANTCMDNILGVPGEEGSFKGYLQSDGLRAYRTYIERHPEEDAITPVSCLAHVRRKFIQAKEDHPKITAWILRCIGQIYRIEEEVKESGGDPKHRKREREKSTRRHYDHLARLIDHLEYRTSITPSSNLGKALSYAQGQWAHLEACFENGRIHFDNNETEGAIRPTKLGMKNWMFVGGAETGWRSAVIYTMVEQVRRHGHDPFAYFKWVFERLPGMTNQDDFEPLLPNSWITTVAAPAHKIRRTAA